MSAKYFSFPGQSIGQRIDTALKSIFPDTGLRTRRRMLDSGEILLRGQRVRASYKIRAGDWLEFSQTEQKKISVMPRLLAKQGEYYYFYKPANLHTVHLAGGKNQSLEDALPGITPTGAIPDIKLLQRLDYETSGIICAAVSGAAVEHFRMAEKAGLCCKYYLAWLCGIMEKEQCAVNALATDDRKKVKILRKKSGRLNQTLFKPLYILTNTPQTAREGLPQIPLTLALCMIRSGCRHQIRAHALTVGHPLYGDSLYGTAQSNSFFLSHFWLQFPNHSFKFIPQIPWLTKIPPNIEKLFEGS